MGTRAVEFNGRTYITPGARGIVRSRPQPPQASEDFNTIILIGDSENGFSMGFKDNPVQEFSDFRSASFFLKKGDLLDAVMASLSPSKDSRFAGASLVKTICTSKNTQASVELPISLPSGMASQKAKVKASIPGKSGNAIRLRVTGSYGIVVNDGFGQEYSSSDFAYQDIQVSYLGNSTEAKLTLIGYKLLIKLKDQTDGTIDLDIDISDYKTIGDVVERINLTNGYSARVLSIPDKISTSLDEVLPDDAVNLKVSTNYILTSWAYEQNKFILSTGLCEIDLSGVVRRPIMPMATFSYLVGGNSIKGTVADYRNAIDYVFEKQVQGFFINILTTDFAVMNYFVEVLAHSNSPDGAFEKFGGCGLNLPDTFSNFEERLDAVKLLNSENIVCGMSPVERYMADGETRKVYPGWMIAVLHNAIKASANMRETPTYKDLNILSCPETLTNREIQKSLQAGGLIVNRKPNNGAFKIVMALTTYQKTNIIYNQSSIVCLALAMTKYLRENIELAFTGEVPAVGSNLDDAAIRRYVDGIFRYDFVEKFGWLTPNIYTGESAYDPNFTVKRDGDAIYFEFPRGNVVSPINYMFFLLQLDVVRGSSNS